MHEEKVWTPSLAFTRGETTQILYLTITDCLFKRPLQLLVVLAA